MKGIVLSFLVFYFGFRLLSSLGRLGLLGGSRGLSGSGLLLGRVTLGGVVLSLGGSPKGKVVAEELHDEGRVLVALLTKGIKLCNCQSVSG
jgi:hypothetical protein